MSSGAAPGATRPAGRAWASEPALLRVVLSVVIASTGLVAAAAFADLDGDVRAWATTALLGVLAIGFEEGSARLARLQIRLRTTLRADMTSVWIVTAGVSLSAGRAVLLLAVLAVYMWFRQHRPAGEPMHRKLYVACSGVLAALAAGWVGRTAGPRVEDLPLGLGGAVPIVLAVLTAIVVARLLITAALVSVGARGRALVGTVYDNLIEIATPCLGGLVALAVEHEPWLAVLVIAPMVTLQRGAVVRELEAAAITDSKTGLLNATAWEQLAQRELARAARDRVPVGVLIIDIDRFKGVNDRHGHLVGDEVLAGVARVIKSAVREYDGIGRFGGEEFVAVLPDADEHDALVVAERIRARVNQLCVADISVRGDQDDRRGEDRLSVSVGVAVLGTNGVELSDLLHAADRALYRAKWNGRNQVQLAQQDGGTPERVTV